MGRKRIDLQPRDLLLLKRLCQLGFLNIDSINNFIFQTNYKNVCRRLVKLRKYGFISFIRRTDLKGTMIYIPQIKNIKKHVDEKIWEQGKQLCALKPWFSRLHEHTDQVQYWGLRILRLFPDVDIKTEYLLDPNEYARHSGGLQARRKVPDFIVEFGKRDEISFEIELHPKSTAAYDQVFMSMFSMRTCPVIYFTRTEAIKRKVLEIAPRWSRYFEKEHRCRHIPFYVKTFDEVKTDEQLTAFLQLIIDDFNPKPADTSTRLSIKEQVRIEIEKEKEMERLRAAHLAQLDTTPAQTPPSLRTEEQREGFARVQQDGQGEQQLEKEKTIWDYLDFGCFGICKDGFFIRRK